MSEKLEQAYCNKCGFIGVPDGMGFHARPSDGEQCNYLCRRSTPANGEQVERVARAMCDRVNGQGDYDDNPERHAGWNAQALAAIAAMDSTPTQDARERVKVLEGKARVISTIGDLVAELETWEPELLEALRYTPEAKLLREWMRSPVANSGAGDKS